MPLGAAAYYVSDATFVKRKDEDWIRTSPKANMPPKIKHGGKKR
jgi:hypothetical protein